MCADMLVINLAVAISQTAGGSLNDPGLRHGSLSKHSQIGNPLCSSVLGLTTVIRMARPLAEILRCQLVDPADLLFCGARYFIWK